MSIEYKDQSNIEQQKLEKEGADKPQTGNDSLNFLQEQKMEDKKDVKESRETPEFRQESFSGKQGLDIVAQERQGLKEQKQEGISPTLGGMNDGNDGNKGGKGSEGGEGENAQDIDLSKEKIKMSEEKIQQEQQKLAEEKSKLTEQERQKQIDELFK
jgi:hypothetical protein